MSYSHDGDSKNGTPSGTPSNDDDSPSNPAARALGSGTPGAHTCTVQHGSTMSAELTGH